jgi:hypothetical protein
MLASNDALMPRPNGRGIPFAFIVPVSQNCDCFYSCDLVRLQLPFIVAIWLVAATMLYVVPTLAGRGNNASQNLTFFDKLILCRPRCYPPRH